MNTLQDRTRGSLIGGAIGDALGYPVEFKKTFEEIQRLYGERGITRLIPQKQRLDDDDFRVLYPCLRKNHISLLVGNHIFIYGGIDSNNNFSSLFL